MQKPYPHTHTHTHTYTHINTNEHTHQKYLIILWFHELFPNFGCWWWVDQPIIIYIFLRLILGFLSLIFGAPPFILELLADDPHQSWVPEVAKDSKIFLLVFLFVLRVNFIILSMCTLQINNGMVASSKQNSTLHVHASCCDSFNYNDVKKNIPATCSVNLRDASALTLLHLATHRLKQQIKLAISSSHSTMTLYQPVLALPL